jgi:hypothetical protein
VTDDGGAHWSNVDGKLPRQWVSGVVASGFDERRAYVALNGYRDDDMTAWVFKTDDLGKTWTSISAGLPAEPVNVIREDTVNPDVLYVGTDRGVYVSLDRGAHWDSLQGNLPEVPVHDLVVHPRERELIAGTHGRSAWVVDVLPLQELAKVRNEAVHVFPVAKTKADRSWRSAPTRWFDDTPQLPTLDVPFWAGSAGTAEFAVLDGNGNPVRKQTIAAHAGINAFTWDLQFDRDLALAAERVALAKDAAKPKTAEESKDKDKGTAPAKSADEGLLAKTPVAEAVRLHQRLFVVPGDYTLRIALNGARSDTKFTVDPPVPQPPRVPAKPKLRGRDQWDRPAPAALPEAASDD